jgi:oxalate---CoA ligase
VRSFFAWMRAFDPTWFTGVPTMHQEILKSAQQLEGESYHAHLRFIRSASSLLPVSVREALEEHFNVVVTESYGLTEIPQLTNTALSRVDRKEGSLGLTGSSEIEILDENGAFLGPNRIGQIAARGPGLMDCYLNDPEDPQSCLKDGWLLTGDLGYLDDDRELYLCGRIKELISRGGENVSPHEIDVVLMAHPAVDKAVAFGIPDSALGEEIAAVLTLKPGQILTAADLRSFVASKLADFKVPRRILFVGELPTSATGKLVRRDMLAVFNDKLINPEERQTASLETPWNPTEAYIAEIWKRLFRLDVVGRDDDFFELGGTSLMAAQMVAELNLSLGVTFQPAILFSAPTPRLLNQMIWSPISSNSSERPLVEIKAGSAFPPMVLLHGDLNGGGAYCRRLALSFGPNQALYSLSPYDMLGERPVSQIEAHAEQHLHMLRQRFPVGPYVLGGFSHGGLIAFEMARKLVALGERVALLVVIDMPVSDPRLRLMREFFVRLGRLLGLPRRVVRNQFIMARSIAAYFREPFRVLLHLSRFSGRRGNPLRSALWSPSAEQHFPGNQIGEVENKLQRQANELSLMIQDYVPSCFDGDIVVFCSERGPASWVSNKTLGWGRVAKRVQIIGIPGNHYTCLLEGGELGKHLSRLLGQVHDRYLLSKSAVKSVDDSCMGV